jgi:hypothetical protein
MSNKVAPDHIHGLEKVRGEAIKNFMNILKTDDPNQECVRMKAKPGEGVAAKGDSSKKNDAVHLNQGLKAKFDSSAAVSATQSTVHLVPSEAFNSLPNAIAASALPLLNQRTDEAQSAAAFAVAKRAEKRLAGSNLRGDKKRSASDGTSEDEFQDRKPSKGRNLKRGHSDSDSDVPEDSDSDSVDSSPPKKVAKSKKAKATKKASAKGKAPRRKKDKDKPRRPLSAYNIYFKAERARILESLSDPNEPSSTDNAKDPVEKDTANKAPEDASKPNSSRPKKSSKKKIPHGKIDFRSLAKVIGQRWAKLDPSEVSIYKKQADLDTARYKKEIEAYHTMKEEQERLKRQAESQNDNNESQRRNEIVLDSGDGNNRSVRIEDQVGNNEVSQQGLLQLLQLQQQQHNNNSFWLLSSSNLKILRS